MTTMHLVNCVVCKRAIDDHAPDCRLRTVTTARNIAPPDAKPKMRWSMFEKYLTAVELQGKRARLTIDRIEIEETHPRPSVTERCPVLYFRETKRGLVLSATNRRALARAFGDEAEACIGKQILVEAVAVQVGGKATMPIRITAPAPGKVDTQTGEVIESAGK